MYQFMADNDPLAEGKVVPYYQKVIDPKGHILKEIESHKLYQLIANLAATLPVK